MTELHDATVKRNVEAARALIKEKPDLVHARDEKQRTALQLAARGGSVEVVTLLIENGADVNAGDASVGQRGSRPLIAPTAVQRAAQVGVAAAAAARQRPAAGGGDGDTDGAVRGAQVDQLIEEQAAQPRQLAALETAECATCAARRAGDAARQQRRRERHVTEALEPA
jgi:hypothetical protein